jgi:alkylhydroperoxidase family enzyme
MARLPYLTRADLAPEHKDLLDRDIALYRLLAHSPGAARAMHGLGRFIRHESGLDARLREMAILQVGWLARSEYEYSHHVKIGRDFGVGDDDLRAIRDETAGRPTGLAALDRAVLRAAREITTDGAVAPATFAELKAAFSPEHLLDLIVTLSFYNGVVRLLASLEIDVEDDYRPYLDIVPLPGS